jgi:hypothetical protein
MAACRQRVTIVPGDHQQAEMLKGSRFDSCEYIIQNMTAQLHTISKQAFLKD